MGSIYLLRLIFGITWIIAGISYLYDRNNQNAFQKKVLLSPLQAGSIFNHLGTLANNNLVIKEKEGKKVKYSVSPLALILFELVKSYEIIKLSKSYEATGTAENNLTKEIMAEEKSLLNDIVVPKHPYRRDKAKAQSSA